MTANNTSTHQQMLGLYKSKNWFESTGKDIFFKLIKNPGYRQQKRNLGIEEYKIFATKSTQQQISNQHYIKYLHNSKIQIYTTASIKCSTTANIKLHLCKYLSFTTARIKSTPQQVSKVQQQQTSSYIRASILASQQPTHDCGV